MRESVFQVAELDCAEEVRVLRRQLEGRDGVGALDFDVIKGLMKVRYDGRLSPAKIIDFVSDAGMRAELYERAAVADAEAQPRRNDKLIGVAVSGFAALLGFSLHWWRVGELARALGVGESLPPWESRVAYGLAILSAYWFVLPKAWKSLLRRRADMNVLIVAATLGAIALGEWLEAASVSFLFAVALLLEHWSVGRARRAISALLRETPPIAHLRQPDGALRDVPVEQAALNDEVLVRSGERVPLDGVVLEGASAVDQAMITGESIPVVKQAGDEVFAGSINGEGSLTVQVRHTSDDSVLARIIRLVDDAQSRRAASQQWVESFANYYTPTVMLLSLLIAVIPPLLMGGEWTRWIYNGLVLLVIACPCALVISTPVSIVSALTLAARRGVLIRGGGNLEDCGRIETVALDKTGTLTTGKPRVQEIATAHGVSEHQLLTIAASLEAHSNHPLAMAIRHAARERGVDVAPVTEFQEQAGRGVAGTVNGASCWLGRGMGERAVETPDELSQLIHAWQQRGWTVVAVGAGERVLGMIGLADPIREQAKPLVAELKRCGIREVVLLTGDNRPTAAAIAEQTGVSSFQAELLPEDKLREVERLDRQRPTAMIGDGVNDSPALAAATVGVAMGGVGSDVAIETADVTLMSDDLSKLPWLIGHARRTQRIIRQNIAFALGTKVVFVVLAAMGIASLWLAILADMGASLLVIFNALRLLKVSEPSSDSNRSRGSDVAAVTQGALRDPGL